MTLEEYTSELKNETEKLLGSSYFVTIRSFPKNNIGELQALNILNGEESTVTPNFYIGQLFERFKEGGKSIKEMAQGMVECYRKTVEENRGCSIAEKIMQESWVRQRLIFRLLNYKKNKEILQKTAHIRFLDMALVYYVLIKEEEGSMGTIRAGSELFQRFGWDEKTMGEEVMGNTVRLLPARMDTLPAALHNKAGAVLSEFGVAGKESGTAVPLIVTNRQGINGAVAVNYPGVLRGLAKKRDSNLILLPSSIHEFLVISDEAGLDIEEMREMVSEVNRTCVLPEEVLSENVYYYDKEKGSMDIAAICRAMR